ncbi:BNR repeat-containing protein [Micromonospora sp. WMMD1082]|uniref:BNR repeat-containing protein n=1 Tax=Micromonospora sp. WMMD1082 TaxID=3016104 RepID=UPI002415B14D|nr:BNR repeat-containing protein [Micromonospora sp. WMMD1082]MDG4793721.1 BNR repeat-containing protein [Micromonospora sp. WMMD1082]
MSLLTVTALAVTVGPTPASFAAAPVVSHASTSTLTTNGRTAVSYSGLMNGESFQQDGITTFNGWQYAAFWDQDGYANLSRRQAPSGTWQNIRLTDYRTTSTDSHNVICIGISPQDGTIHLAFDMHSDRFKYRRSATGLATSPGSATWSASSFGAVQNSLAGTNMPTVTYPQFFSAPDGTLQMAIRTGVSGNGDEVLYEYRSGSWSYIGEFIDGTSYDNNPYLFGIEYDREGLLHVTWTVRETPNGSTNHDLFYAYSRDKGRSWRNNAGTVVATAGSNPLASNAAGLRVWPNSQNRGLMNQESQVVDAAGNVHVLSSHLPANTPSITDFNTARNSAVLVHYWRDKASKQWNQRYLGYTEGLSRGDIAVDSRDNLYVVSGHSSTRILQIATASKASNWSDWTVRHRSAATYMSDPLIDHALLPTQNVLSIFTPHSGGSRIEVQNWNTSGG